MGAYFVVQILISLRPVENYVYVVIRALRLALLFLEEVPYSSLCCRFKCPLINNCSRKAKIGAHCTYNRPMVAWFGV